MSDVSPSPAPETPVTARPVRWKPLRWILAFTGYAALLCWFLFGPGPEWIERYYTRGFYRIMTGLVAPITNVVPFSIAIVLLATLVFGFPIAWIGNWIYLRRWQGRSRWLGLAWGPKWLFLIAPWFLLWFLVFWGAGYQRIPPEVRLGMDTSDITAEQGEALRGQLLAIILRDQPKTPEDRDAGRAIASASSAMETTIAEWDGRSIRLPKRVKATPPGFLICNGTSGICVPYTLEPHVDGGLPDTAFVSVAAHEIGHIAGMCTEAEASLAGYVAGLRADDPYARYAVALDLYRDIAAQIRNDEKRKAAFEALPDVAKEDMRRAAEAGRKYRIEWFQRVSRRAYNQYLKSQGIEEGIKNYGYAVNLFVYMWREGRVPCNGLSRPEVTPPVPEMPAQPAPPAPPA